MLVRSVRNVLELLATVHWSQVICTCTQDLHGWVGMDSWGRHPNELRSTSWVIKVGTAFYEGEFLRMHFMDALKAFVEALMTFSRIWLFDVKNADDFNEDFVII